MHKTEALNIYLKTAEMMGEDINGTIKILKEGLKCAELLNEIEKIEYFQNLIEVLETHEESD